MSNKSPKDDHIEFIGDVDTLDLLNSMNNTGELPIKGKVPSIVVDDDDDSGAFDIDDEKTHIKEKTAKKPEETPAEADEEVVDEPFILHQKQWIEDGKLPKDFKPTLDVNKVDEALYDHTVKSLVETKFDEYVKEKGLTPEEIDVLRGRNLGIDSSLYGKEKAYLQLSKIVIDPDSEDFEEETRDLLNVFYKDLKMPEKKIAQVIETDLLSPDIVETIEEAKKHFAGKALILNKEIKASEEAAKKKKEDAVKSHIDKEDAILKSKKIGDLTLTQAQLEFVQKGLREKTEVITRKDGTSVKVSLYTKKIHDITHNPEKALLSKVRFLLEDTNVETAEEVGGKKFLKDLNRTVDRQNYSNKKNRADVELLD